MNSSNTPRTLIAVGIVTALVLLSLAVLVYVAFVKVPEKGYHLGKQVATDLARAFQFTPEVRVNERIILAQNAPILELATVKRQFAQKNTWEHRWLGSHKKIVLEGTYEAKAGFDLREPFTIFVDSRTNTVRARMSPPRILSVQRLRLHEFRGEDGWWNKITDEERAQALNELDAKARRNVRESDILDEARRTVEERIREIVLRNGAKAEFEYVDKVKP
ncbi:MAG: DUF4230 domain-containing protein [Verrucomicrobiae bacterium]|nr:DUF4230 domain-containing protein [Verrucomicrobiae bacterium]